MGALREPDLHEKRPAEAFRAPMAIFSVFRVFLIDISRNQSLGADPFERSEGVLWHVSDFRQA